VLASAVQGDAVNYNSGFLLRGSLPRIERVRLV